MMRRRQSAFSLIEVLLAMALFSVSIYLLSQTFTNTFLALESIRSESSDEDLRHLTRQHVFAMEKREDAEDGGNYELPDRTEAAWEMTIEETNLVDLFRCRLTITLAGESVVSTHWLLRPEWSEAGEREALFAEKKQEYLNTYGEP